MRFWLSFCAISLFLIFCVSGVFAQSFTIEPAITLSINPPDPEPGEKIIATLTSYETNLDLANIIWTHNSDTKEGYGETQFIINAGLDETKNDVISASIILTDGQKIEKQIIIAPTSFDIAWEALNSKTPPFYLGKKIPIRQNSIRVAVVSPNNSSNPTSYTWTRNGSRITNTGGSAKPYIDFTNTELDKNESIDVAIVSKDKRASRTINIPFTNSRVLFYEYSPLNGLNLGNTIKDNVLGYENTVSVFMVPFGFNTVGKNLTSWNLSGNPVSNQQNPYLLSFNSPNEKGKVDLSVIVKNIKTIYQKAEGSLELIF